ncbi:hypothetical protein [uncultured Alteromonas sp.]|uniref:hypothetical protein n=1 Tax=uncultured Alteromonas sp. TaxID=179113 RepID=UPI0030EBB127
MVNTLPPSAKDVVVVDISVPVGTAVTGFSVAGSSVMLGLSVSSSDTVSTYIASPSALYPVTVNVFPDRSAVTQLNEHANT